MDDLTEQKVFFIRKTKVLKKRLFQFPYDTVFQNTMHIKNTWQILSLSQNSSKCYLYINLKDINFLIQIMNLDISQLVLSLLYKYFNETKITIA